MIRCALVIIVCTILTPSAEACDLRLLRTQLERAMEPLDHAYSFEDIDPAEMSVEFERHMFRLDRLIATPPDGCREHPAGSALISYAERLRNRGNFLVAKSHPR